MRQDMGLDPIALFVGNVTGNDQPPASAPGNFDGKMWPLDFFDSPEKDQWRVEPHVRAKIVGIERNAIGNHTPAPDVPHILHHPLTDGAECQCSMRERMTQPYGALTDSALICHELRQFQRQNWRHISYARKRMDEIELAAHNRFHEGRGIPQCIDGGKARGTLPRNQPASTRTVRMGKQSHIMAPGDKPAREHINDPLDSSVVRRRHRKFGVSS